MGIAPTTVWGEKPAEQPPQSVWQVITSDVTLLLYVGAVFFELLVGILTYYGVVPGALRWAGDLLVLAMIGLTFGRMLLSGYIPKAVVFLVAVIMLTSTVATLQGQGAAATLWGIWFSLKYAIIGLYVFLWDDWPPDFARWYYRFCFSVMGLQVVVQILQFLSGEPAGDNLTGTFGRHATQSLFAFIVLSVGLAMGYWLVHGDWKILAFVALAGTLASVLGAMRFFPVGMAILIVFGGILYLLRGTKFDRSMLAIVGATLVLASFPLFYNRITAETREIRTWQETIADTERTSDYFNGMNYDVDAGIYRVGRNFSVRYSWAALQQDMTTFLFGYGIGARSYSDSLGIVGIRNRNDILGVISSSMALILIEELGVVGLSLLFLFLAWLAIKLWHCARSECSSDVRVVAYGLLVFTLFWPVLFWYNKAWTYGFTMLLYWGGIGYVLRYYLTYTSVQTDENRRG